MSKTLKNKAIGGFFWTLAEKFGAQGVSFVVSIILARLLTPEDYGIVALVTVFTSIANVFVKSGMGSALIQKKDADSLDFSTVFYFNIATSLILYVVLYLAAPTISAFYDSPQLTLVLRVCSISFVLNGINNVQQAYVSKHLEFKKFFLSTAFGTVLSAVVGIVMAYCGCGVWALVTQQLLNQVVDTLILHFTIAWKPKFEFSWTRFKGMYLFAYRLLATELLESLYNDLQSLIIGKKYSTEQLAFYNKGCSFPKILVRNLDNSIQSVAFPLLSNEQANKGRFAYIRHRACSLSFYFVCPMMVGMICVAEPLVKVLLTEKWLPSVPFLQLYCITYLLRPLATTNTQALYALGRSDVTLKLDLIHKIISVVLLVTAVFLFDGALAICGALVISIFVRTCLSMMTVAKLTDISVLEQVKSISGILFASAVMGAVCGGLGIVFTNVGDTLLLIIQIAVGCLTYLLLSIFLKLDSFEYILNYIKKDVLKRKR